MDSGKLFDNLFPKSNVYSQHDVTGTMRLFNGSKNVYPDLSWSFSQLVYYVTIAYISYHLFAINMLFKKLNNVQLAQTRYNTINHISRQAVGERHIQNSLLNRYIISISIDVKGLKSVSEHVYLVPIYAKCNIGKLIEM